MTEPASAPPPPEPPVPVRHGFFWRLWHHPLFKLGLAAAILAFLFGSGRLDFSKIAPRSGGWLVLGTLAMLPSFLLVSFRYRIILRALELNCTYWQALTWTMVGAFWDVAMPSVTGGDLIKAVYVAQAYGRERWSVAALSVAVDRGVGLLGLFFFALSVSAVGLHTLLADPRLHYVPLILLAVCLAALTGFLLLASKRMQESPLRQRLMSRLPFAEKFEKLYRGLAGLGSRPGLLVSILALSVLNHAFISTSLVFLSWSIGLEYPLLGGLVVMPLAMFLNVFGVAGGFGAGEAAFDYLFEHFLNMQPGDGAALALVFHLACLAVRIVVGFPFYWMAGPALPHGKVEG